MKWRTKISTHSDGDLYLRGHKLIDLIGSATFSQAIFLAIAGRMPTKKEEKMLDVILISGIEHGVEAPSAFSARVVASTGNQMNAALAAGVLAVGDWHGGAIEAAMRLLERPEVPAELVRESLARDVRLPGYGHKIYKTEDPRTKAIFVAAQKLGFGKKYLARARAIERELAKQSGKTLPLNIDGAIAAVLLEFGLDARLGKAFFILARMPGMIAHVYEEMRDEKPYRRFDEEDVEYIGPELKKKKIKK